MKKLLIATTALVATAGVAAAEISMSGEGKAGLVYNSGYNDAFWGTPGDSNIKLHYNVEVIFEAAGQTDGGLAFGAEITVETGAVGDSVVWFSGSWGKLSFGDVKSGDKAIVGQLPGIEYQNSADMRKFGGLGVVAPNNAVLRAALNSVSGYVSDGGATALYEHKIGGFKFALSTSQFGAGSENVGVGVGYETDMWNIAAGYGTDGTRKQASIKAGVTFGETTMTAMFRKDNSFTDHYWGLSAEHTFGAVKVAAFYVDQHNISDVYGLGASYDLGGGAKLKGGISRASFNIPAPSVTIADLGVVFSF